MGAKVGAKVWAEMGSAAVAPWGVAAAAAAGAAMAMTTTRGRELAPQGVAAGSGGARGPAKGGAMTGLVAGRVTAM